MPKASYCFYGVPVEISTESRPLLDALEKDFHYFLSSDSAIPHQKGRIRVVAHQSPIPRDRLPQMAASRQSFNSISYDKDGILYNDYYGEALSILDRKSESAQVFSPDFDRLHEICFLLIQSRVGKKLDLKGLHKLHACAVTYKGKDLAIILPMRGGKSTLLMQLLRDPEIQILSDDTPLVDRWGRLHPFPLRIGMEKLPQEPVIAPSFVTTFARKQWGTKLLVDLRAFPNTVSKGGLKPFIIRGVRSSRNDTQLVSASKLEIFRELLKSLVIGIGLPMILEYFLERGMADTGKRLRILLSRLWSVALTLRCQARRVELGKSVQQTAELIKKAVS